MKSKIKSRVKKSVFARKVYFYLVSKMPFIENILSLYRYSKWLTNYRQKLTCDNNEYYEHIYQELHLKCLPSVLKSEPVKPLIIMTTYNDHDIIESIIRENDKLGYEQIIIDNWSDDGTWSIITRLKSEISSVLNIMQFPFEGPSNDYQWKAMLDLKSEIALNYKHRWILHQDSDEITISPFFNINVGIVLNAIRELGFNCVSLRMIDFTPVDNNFTVGNPLAYFNYYRISSIPSYGLQNKIWYQGDERIDLSHAGGHDAAFKDRKVFPIRLPRFHYSIRSIEHAKSKYSPKRLVRSESERSTLGWHTHVEVKLNEKIIFDKEELIEYNFSDLYSNKFHWFTYNG